MSPDIVGEFEARHIAKHPFRDDHVERTLLETIDGSHGVAGADDIVADCLQAVVNPLTVIRIAVDEKDAGHDQRKRALYGTVHPVPD